jgi:hypothetical protein
MTDPRAYAQFDFTTNGNEPVGFGIFGDFWGGLNLESYHELEGSLKERVEVWFDKVR